MAREVHVSFRGMSEYVRLCREQEQYLGKVEDLIGGSCANFGAFSGFMLLLSGTYRDAHATVVDEVRAASRAAGQLGASIADTRADFRAADEGVTNDLDAVRTTVECAVAPPIGAPGPGGAGTPAPIKTANAGAGVLANAETMAPHLPQHLVDGLPSRTPPLEDAGIRGLPTGGVEIVTQTLDTIAAGESIAQAEDDEQQYEHFENLHRRLGGQR